jgi:hypothetical protein
MKALRLARAFGAAFALVLLGFASHAALIQNNAPQGPWLGDGFLNLGTLLTAYQTSASMQNHAAISASQTLTQAGCTQLDASTMQEIKTSASTGSVCLPTAIAGKEVLIGNATGQTIDIFSSVTSFTSGTADTINGTAGTSAYTGLSGTNHQVQCDAMANGTWYCASGT